MNTLLRFAPSPTGPLHLGGLRTALFNKLFAQSHGGKWILRIEDTDASRCTPGSVDDIRRGLDWAGLAYDFGPGADNSRGPYFQSERLDLYHTYAHRLLETGDAYRCFCSADELQIKREHLKAAGSTSTYDRSCRKLTEEEVTRRVKSQQPFVIRLDDTVAPALSPFSDMLFGDVRDAQGSLPTDPILVKRDLFPTYHLASVVDDHEMGVSHVLRGEEWLPSLPLHRSLYARLKLTAPIFGHLPLLLNPDGSKMSKRHGDVRVSDFIRKGWEPDAVLNWLAFAGRNLNNPELSTRPASVNELISSFSLDHYTNRRTVLDPVLLSQLNKRHIERQLHDESSRNSLLAKALVQLRAVYPDSTILSQDYVLKVIETLKDRLERIGELPETGRIFFDGSLATSLPPPTDIELYRSVVRGFRSWVAETTDPSDVETSRKYLSQEIHCSKKDYMAILRHALGGSKHGPPMKEILSLLGPEEILRRLDNQLPSQ
ncbi:Probable glutamate--tRNA ligase, mitochondrial; AltName: Full=Glutamyl-tRNA synthetase; Short=GluRS; Flags: Precursor [Serendipita indica DSM 11827]|nr:Probable glutamate--tRNA ligase, mitochondrial; AltName: Full=Glutamyl-tRNA synthetase; Short=GluRS; Flags: Precursor [Serendipita indica DSM 11827]